jgi:hypothetical protein
MFFNKKIVFLAITFILLFSVSSFAQYAPITKVVNVFPDLGVWSPSAPIARSLPTQLRAGAASVRYSLNIPLVALIALDAYLIEHDIAQACQAFPAFGAWMAANNMACITPGAAPYRRVLNTCAPNAPGQTCIDTISASRSGTQEIFQSSAQLQDFINNNIAGTPAGQCNKASSEYNNVTCANGVQVSFGYFVGLYNYVVGTCKFAGQNVLAMSVTGGGSTCTIPGSNNSAPLPTPDLLTQFTTDLTNGTPLAKKAHEEMERKIQEEMEKPTGTSEPLKKKIDDTLGPLVPSAVKTPLEASGASIANGGPVTPDVIKDAEVEKPEEKTPTTNDPSYTGSFTPGTWPAVPSIGTRFNDFTNSLKQTSLWSLPSSMTTDFPSGGDPVISFNAGVYGSHSYSFASWGSALYNVIKGIVLVICSWVAIKIVTKGGGG